MATVTAVEAEAKFSALLDRVARGEEIVITKDEKPVARLVPEQPPRDLAKVREAVQEMTDLQERMRKRGMEPLTVEEILSARDEGRK